MLALLLLSPLAGARPPVYGVLGDTKWLDDATGCPGCLNTERPALLRESGISAVEIRVPWSEYEKSSFTYSPEKIAFLRAKVEMLRRNGLKGILNIEWHRVPEWVWEIPDSSYVGNKGTRTADLPPRSRGRRPNIVFNQLVRDHLTGVIASLAKELGPENFSSVRVSNGGIQGELAYPDGTGEFWAYDTNASASGESHRPATIPRRPLPDWKPGGAITGDQAREWYAWYIGALADSVEFQIAALRQAGFSGPFQVMMPGKGARPGTVTEEIGKLSSGKVDGNHLVRMGVAWHAVAKAIEDRREVSLHCSSVAEEDPVDLSRPGDARDPEDPVNREFIQSLGASRWIALVADYYGFQKSGENPGLGDTNAGYYQGAMAANAIAQASAAGFVSFDWAHHERIWGDHGLLEDKIAPAIDRERKE